MKKWECPNCKEENDTIGSQELTTSYFIYDGEDWEEIDKGDMSERECWFCPSCGKEISNILAKKIVPELA